MKDQPPITNNSSPITKLIECPRDAMQGLHDFIPTEEKTAYINQLLKVGFDTIDFGSFVSPKAIPQLKDTAQVLKGLELDNTSSKLLAIIANERGAKDAVQFDKINYLGFPFSLSETFQQRNTNASREEALDRIAGIQNLCLKHGKHLIVYLSMGFGNPYGEDWNADMTSQWVEKFVAMDISILALADTIGVAEPESITYIFSNLIPEFPKIEFGAHFHSTPETAFEKLDAAFNAGCLRFDGAINGIGGCPMADDDLVGNLATETIKTFFERTPGVNLDLDESAFSDALKAAGRLFGRYS